MKKIYLIILMFLFIDIVYADDSIKEIIDCKNNSCIDEFIIPEDYNLNSIVINSSIFNRKEFIDSSYDITFVINNLSNNTYLYDNNSFSIISDKNILINNYEIKDYIMGSDIYSDINIELGNYIVDSYTIVSLNPIYFYDSSENTSISFTFSKEKQYSKIHIYYIDTFGDFISNTDTISGIEGQSYDIEYKQIDGYKLQRVDGVEHGIFKDIDEDIFYMYDVDYSDIEEVNTKVDSNNGDIFIVIGLLGVYIYLKQIKFIDKK